MKIRKEDLHESPQTNGNKMLDVTSEMYRSFNEKLAFQEGDPTWLLAIKLLGRGFGILFMLFLSPFVLIGLFIAFAAVL